MTDPLHDMIMNEQRRAERDGTELCSVTTFVELADGTRLEGVAKDLSDGGMGIAGPTDGLNVGDEVDLILVVLEDQKVRYRAEIMHIDHMNQFFGLRFRSPPEPVEEHVAMWCRRCRREFASTVNFCPACGTKLHRR